MDDLKEIWQKGEIEIKPASLPEKLKYNRLDLAHRILGSLEFEYYGTMVLMAIAIPLLFYIKLYLPTLLLAVTTIPMVLHYRSFIKELKSLDYEKDVHEYLKELYAFTRRFFKHYQGLMIISIALSPLLMLGILYHEGQEFLNYKPLRIAILATAAAAVTTYIGFHIKYGRHFKKIKEMYDMLKEE